MIKFSPHRLRAARAEKGWTQARLAHALVVSERNIQRWEQGRNAPRGEAIVAIAEALGKPIDFFYANGSEPK